MQADQGIFRLLNHSLLSMGILMIVKDAHMSFMEAQGARTPNRVGAVQTMKWIIRMMIN